MNFSDIKPFVRHVHRMKITRAWGERVLIPRDNRLFYCIDGSGAITVAGKRCEIGRGAALLIPAGTPYILHITDGNPGYIGVNFYYPFKNRTINGPVIPVPLEECEDDLIIERITFSDEPLLNEPLSVENMTSLEDLLSPMVVTYNKKLLYYELELSGVFTEVISWILRAKKLGDLSESDSAISAILSYIHNNYAEKLTNAKIGAIFGYNQNYVSDLIKSATTQPLHKYIESVRVERAAELLTTSDIPVGRIAELSGFCDIYHFSKMFKSRFGVSPRAYRKNS